ncbi:MAG: hypothetical protein HY289_10265 [Planctomycetes bacterium]|nr:hypothetical protein [Planctomycetota bacterium]
MKKILCLVGVLMLAPSANACTIPVFRYALEKWDLTVYEIVVYHRGPLPTDLQKTIDAWNAAPNKANVEFTTIDLDKVSASNANNNHLQVWHVEGNDAKTPWMAVRYQKPRERGVTTWSGPCTQANLNVVLDSPLRQAVLAHLTRGASGVYVFLTSGDAKKDHAAYAMVRKHLEFLETKIKLPEQSKDGPQMRLPISLKVWLPILVLDRKKPEESALVQRLLAMEDGLAEETGPIVFAVIGKGRALPALYGKQLNEEWLTEITQYLCNKCSCDVKSLNPGDDLLMVANWPAIEEKLFDGKDGVPMPTEAFMLAPLPPASVPGVDLQPLLDEMKEQRALLAEVRDALRAKSTVAAKTEAPPTITYTTTKVETPTPEFECPLCKNWMWIATGAAGMLVLVSGGWVCWLLLRK